MKTILLVLIFSFSAFSQAKVLERTYKTLFTCEQDDGDTWYEIGLVKTAGAPSGHNLIVVKHTDDQKKLVFDRPALLTKQSPLAQQYEDRGSTVRLTIAKSVSQYVGHFSMLVDGAGSVSNLKVNCFYLSEISY